MVKIFGGADCRASQRALRWLDERGVPFRFSDLRACGIDSDTLDAWITAFGWAQLIDKRSVAWRARPLMYRQQLTPHEAKALIASYPVMLKSPIIGARDHWLLGWNAKNKVRLMGLIPLTPFRARLLWRFRSPHHSISESGMRIPEP